MTNIKIDDLDRQILTHLQLNARISMSDLSKSIGLTKTPIVERIKRMEKHGLIVGYRAILSPLQLGMSHVTFVEVRMLDTREGALQKFNQAVSQIPEIEECYMIAGNFDYLIKVRTKDIADYRKVMAEKISSLPFVHSTSTHVAMEAVTEQSLIDIS